jgi:hypothetical protein
MPTTTQRGYGHKHQQATRLVLARDPLCTECQGRPSTSAHHDPPLALRDRRGGGFASDPTQMRGVCGPCHKALTAELNRQLLRQRRQARDEIEDEQGTSLPPNRNRPRRYPRVWPGAIDVPISGPVEVRHRDGTVERIESRRRYRPRS